jgi:hypothetical protein
VILALLFACAPEPEGRCPSWSGLTLETRTWTYAPFGAGEAFDVVATPTSLDHFVVTRPGYDAEFVCDETGLYLLTEHAVSDALEAWWSYEPPALRMPAVLAEGTAWSLGAGYAYHDDSGVALTRSDDTQFAVVGAAEQHVAAGGFDTLAVQSRDGTEESTRYYAEGVGLVLDADAQLVNVD